MADLNEAEAISVDYWSLGYVDNPFALEGTELNDDEHWLRQLGQAATNRLLAATQRALEVEHAKPIWISLGAELPVYYSRMAENQFLARATAHPHINVLALNIPLETMRIGKSRGTLMELSELIAAAQFDETLGAYVASLLTEPDTSLSEYEALAELDLAAIAQRFSDSPVASVEEYFGSNEASRRPDAESELVLQDAYLRTIALEPDPEEEPDSSESDAFTEAVQDPNVLSDTPASLDGVGDEDSEDEEPEPDPRHPIADYVIAYMKANLSPVLARATRAYVSDGFAAVAQELKVTKAPKKTVAALVRFAACRYRKVLFIYDSFDPWIIMDDTTKANAVGALAALRWSFGPQGVIALAVPENLAPQLEEQFASADRIDWTFAEIPTLSVPGAPYDEALVQNWLDAAAVTGESAIRADGPELADLVSACDGDMMRYVTMACIAFADAASRGLSTVDAQAVSQAIDAT